MTIDEETMTPPLDTASEAASAEGAAKTPVDRLRDLVARRATGLQTAYQRDDSTAVASLALLRRGVGQRPGQDFRLIPLTIAGVHENTRTLPDEPTDEEHAAYTALTLFAAHQQSQRNASMHRPGYSFGRSARLLGRRSGARDAVRARFTAIGTASTWDETVHHARGVIQQLRAFDIPLDYGRFAGDLYLLRKTSSAERVRLAWGRDFYRVRHPEDDGEDMTDSDEPDTDGATDTPEA